MFIITRLFHSLQPKQAYRKLSRGAFQLALLVMALGVFLAAPGGNIDCGRKVECFDDLHHL